jgi:hypothetical protein
MTTATIEPVRRQIVVAAPQQACFDMFTAGIDRWWPRSHHIGDADLDEVIIEPREGGRWYARHVDGSETRTGYVTVWAPPERVALAWQLDAEWHFDATLVTTVDVRFVAEAPDRTRVELEHRDLERFGPQAEKMRTTFEGPGAWEGILADFAAAVQGR